MSSNQNRQAGVVSIFTVLFFMIFVSIITVGFVKIIGDEQRQSTDNDLSASALSAAQSGVEEAKRVLLFCRSTSNAAEIAACTNVFSSTACNALSGNTTVVNALGIDIDADGAGVVSENPNYLQRWTCLTINPVTDDVDDLLVGDGESQLIPLTGVGGFDTLRVSWHATATDREGIPGAYPAGINRISQPEWTNLRYPAALRVEIISHPAAGVNVDTQDQVTSGNPSRTLVLFPSSSGATTDYTILSSDPRTDDPNTRATPASPLPVRCASLAALPTYACTANLSFAGLPSNAPGANQYYARISAIYAKTHVNLALLSGGSSGSRVSFNNVQPVVDVTGKTNDVFRRVKARVTFDSAFFMPNYAVESGQAICKNMLVTDRAATSSDTCNP